RASRGGTRWSRSRASPWTTSRVSSEGKRRRHGVHIRPGPRRSHGCSVVFAVRRVLFVFLDGVGLGPADPAVNALAAARLPTLEALLGGRRPTIDAAGLSTREATLVGLDAVLGVDGLPQSGTGQAALLTGENAPARFGRHYGPWVPTMLRPLVESESILAQAKR